MWRTPKIPTPAAVPEHWRDGEDLIAANEKAVLVARYWEKEVM